MKSQEYGTPATNTKKSSQLHSFRGWKPTHCWFQSSFEWVFVVSSAQGASSMVCSFKISSIALIFAAAICSSCTKCWSSPCDKLEYFFLVQDKVRLLAPCHLPAGENCHQDGAVGGILDLQCVWADGLFELPSTWRQNAGFSQQNLFHCGSSGRCQAFESCKYRREWWWWWWWCKVMTKQGWKKGQHHLSWPA